MDTIGKVKKILNDLIASLQKARLYSTDHLIFKNSVNSIYKNLQDVLREKGELVIGIVSGEFAFEKEIFFELSNFDLAKNAIVFLQEKGIEKIVFYPHLNEDELYMFITFLVNPQSFYNAKSARKNPSYGLTYDGGKKTRLNFNKL